MAPKDIKDIFNEVLDKTLANAHKKVVLMGDLNDQIGERLPNEDGILGGTKKALKELKDNTAWITSIKSKATGKKETKRPEIMEIATAFYSHMIRSKKKKWTKEVTEWCPRDGKRRKGRPKIRWEDDMKKVAGIKWQRNAENKKTWITLGEAYAKGQADNVTDVEE
ncbi:hypothetical protein EVAR_63872_1 [Eumeta japonica]|uniref:Craniofacial development protein 2 n=1 Tax=Eumeta variegata TaxID=151549 RepID=A0A4C2A004_EUMVA|nr:hypothetical protein EVAR_63872_1 [Eumeta japonica]